MELLGRAEECARIEAVLDAARRGRSRALVVRGEAGIGKTALLGYAEGQAEGLRVVRTLGVEREADLAFAGLLEICRPLLGLLEQLPPPQAAALRGAFALEAAAPAGRFAVAVATLGLVARAAEEQPLLVLVDDAQWLDGASADALSFAARRLEADAVALLFALRDGEGFFDTSGLEQLVVGGIDREAARRLVSASAAGPLVPEVEDKLVAAGSGNPLALTELPAALTAGQREGAELLGPVLPLATGLARAFARHVEHLAAPDRQVLLLAALSLDADVVRIGKAARAMQLDPDGLGRAEDAGLVGVDAGRVEFRHPLVRSAVVHQALPSQRRASHAGLAAAYGPDSDERAWHVAAAASGTDADAARLLGRTADRARARNAHASAATAYIRAAELAAEGARRARLLLAAADVSWLAGRPQQVVALLERALASVPEAEPRLRAEIQQLRGHVLVRSGQPSRGRELLVGEAKRIAPFDRGKAAYMLSEAAEAIVYDAGRSADSDEMAMRAASMGVGAGGFNEFIATFVGATAQLGLGDRAQALEAFAASARLFDRDPALADDLRALVWRHHVDAWSDDYPSAKRHVERAIALARRQSALGELAPCLCGLASYDYALGHWDEAAAGLAEALRLTLETGQLSDVVYAYGFTAYLAAVRGRVEECRRAADRVREFADLVGAGEIGGHHEYAGGPLGLLELGLGNPRGAIAELVPVTRLDESQGEHGPAMQVYDLIEARTRAGDSEHAHTALRQVEGRVRPWEQAGALRCRGLLVKEPDCYRALAGAAEVFAALYMPFEVARTELCHGERLRRAGERRDARRLLAQALETFQRLGAAPWIARVEAELRASGATLRRAQPSQGEELTPQELQIALQVAVGKSNRDVAAALFLSPKTVELHLSRVYRKLGLRSRAELIHRWAATRAAGNAPALSAEPASPPATADRPRRRP